MTDLDAKENSVLVEKLFVDILMSKIGKINISIPDKVKVVMSGSILNIEDQWEKNL